MGKATKLIAEMQILLFSAADGKLQAQHSSCHWKKLFSYVVCAVWLKKKTTQFMATVNVWMVTLWIGV